MEINDCMKEGKQSDRRVFSGLMTKEIYFKLFNFQEEY